jgi:stage III sporulation protein AB
MEMMISEIRYSKATLPECLRKLTDRVEEPYKEAFLAIHRSMEDNTGESFASIYKKHMESCLSCVPLKAHEKDLLLKMGAGSGFEDSEMQIRSIERNKEVLKDIIAGLEREITEKSRMALGLGAMGGLLLVIILL